MKDPQHREQQPTLFGVPTFVISMHRAAQRRAKLRGHPLLHDVASAYVPAVEGEALTDEAQEVMCDGRAIASRYERRLIAGEIGCAESHRKVYRSVLAYRVPLAIVLEDDAVPEEGFAQTLRHVLTELSTFPPDDPWICLLSDTRYPWRRRLVGTAIPPRTFRGVWVADPRRPKPIWSAYAYVVSRGAARAILDAEPSIQLLADDWLARLRQGTLRHVFLARPAFIHDGAFSSDVDPQSVRPWTSGTFVKRMVELVVRQADVLRWTRIPDAPKPPQR